MLKHVPQNEEKGGGSPCAATLVAESTVRPAGMTGMWNHRVVLQHVEQERPGIIAREAEERGCEVDILRLDRTSESLM